jgi:hypothetical protein
VPAAATRALRPERGSVSCAAMNEQYATRGLPMLTTPIFEESQAFRQWWLLIPLSIAALAAWSMFFVQVVSGRAIGTNPAPDVVL